MSATITIITTKVIDPEQFESMYIDERRRVSWGWQEFPSRTAKLPDEFFIIATRPLREARDAHFTFGIFECEPQKEAETGLKLQTCMIDWKHLEKEVVPMLAWLVETNADETARALRKHGGETADLARVQAALRGAWPESADPAEEAAAFAHYLLKYVRRATSIGLGICWELRTPWPDRPGE